MIKIRYQYPKIKLELDKKVRVAKALYLHEVMPALLRDLQGATPVDTGHARDSWELAYEGTTAKITNSAEYMKYLNAGSSAQAPSYFIEATVLKYGKPNGVIVNYTD